MRPQRARASRPPSLSWSCKSIIDIQTLYFFAHIRAIQFQHIRQVGHTLRIPTSKDSKLNTSIVAIMKFTLSTFLFGRTYNIYFFIYRRLHCRSGPVEKSALHNSFRNFIFLTWWNMRWIRIYRYHKSLSRVCDVVCFSRDIYVRYRKVLLVVLLTFLISTRFCSLRESIRNNKTCHKRYIMSVCDSRW